MALNFGKIGRQVAVINGGRYDKKKLYLTEEKGHGNDEYIKDFTSFHINDEGKFLQSPSKEREREVYYIVGASGSGKSTYATALIKEIKKIRKDYPLYVFSTLNDDFETLNPLRVKLTDDLISNPIEPEELKNSICVFDDLDIISNKKLRESILGTVGKCLEIGRHFNIYCIFTSHLATKGHETKRILNEAHSITIFPHSGSGRGMSYLLENYCGLSKQDIKKIKSLKSRWATVYKHYPQMILSEKDAYLLHEN